jgi:predicted AlkP superfamily pyrophosphatase or phosphodiesterase
MSGASEDHHPKLLLISMDGFGWNFLNKLPQSELKNFNSFIEQGVHVRWIENVFPTNTRTNHMSMVTGLYPESHGMVDNEMYDPVFDARTPDFLSTEDSRWVKMSPEIEPVWVTNMKHQDGRGRGSGTIHWPNAEPEVFRPDHITGGEWDVSEEADPPNARVDRALDWLQQGKCNFVALYLNNPDEAAHMYGPDSPEVLDVIRSRDAVVGHLLKRLDDAGDLGKALNVIITADHGQHQVYKSQMIHLDKYVDSSWYTPVPTLDNGSTVVNMWPKEGTFVVNFAYVC